MSGMTAAASSGTQNTAIWARNLPSTMPGMLTGLVSSSWSVLARRSSAKLRMDSAGSRNSSKMVQVYKTPPKSGEANIRFWFVKYRPSTARNTATTTYPIMPVK